MSRGVGRPPKKALPGGTTTLTLRIPAEVKNLLVDLSEGFGISMTSLIIMWLEREIGEQSADPYSDQR